jgi:hypothetical protein
MFDSAFEAALGRSFPIEIDQRGHIIAADGTPPGFSRKRSKDRFGASFFDDTVRVRTGVADEDRPSRSGFARAGGIVRAADLNAPQVRRHPRLGDVDAGRIGPQKRKARTLIDCGGLRDEGHLDVVRTRRHRDAYFPVVVDPVPRRAFGRTDADGTGHLADLGFVVLVESLAVGPGRG